MTELAMLLATATVAFAQVGTIGTGVTLGVRTNETIRAKSSFGSGICNGKRTALRRGCESGGCRIGTARGRRGNRRTGKFVGGGAVPGTIIGVIAGGGKGAAIGAASGAVAGAGTQTLTPGKSVRVPAESVLMFRLERPLRVDIADNGYSRRNLSQRPQSIK